MISFLFGLEIVIAILLSIFILLQQKSSGLGSMAGGSGDTVQTERRGGEKVLHQATVVLAFLFCGIAFLIPVLT